MNTDMITEYQGLQVIPPLIHTAQGWAEQQPMTCSCGSVQFLIGWTACSCRTDTVAPGHRTWECRACGHRSVLGCLGKAGPGPMDSYGCRTGPAVGRR